MDVMSSYLESRLKVFQTYIEQGHLGMAKEFAKLEISRTENDIGPGRKLGLAAYKTRLKQGLMQLEHGQKPSCNRTICAV